MAKTKNGRCDMRIEYVALSTIERWPQNPKLHADAVLDASLDRFGYVAPLLRDEGTGRLVAGHGRLDRLVARKAAGKEPPERIQVRRGEWLVPVIRGVSFASAEEAEAYLLADNQTTVLGGWGPEIVGFLERARQSQRGFEGLGFTQADLKGFKAQFANAGDPDEGPAVDPTDAILEKWAPLGVAVGSLWEIPSADGQRVHRVLCGDARKPEDVERLMQGRKPKLGQHDPPYGVSCVSLPTAERTRGAVSNRQRGGKEHKTVFTPMVGDEEVFDAEHLLGAADTDCLWGANNFPAKLSPSAEWIVWTKLDDDSGKSHFSSCELAYVTPPKNRVGHVRRISHRRRVGPMDAGERLAPTQKPIAVIAKPIEWYTQPGDLVADWYCGSGTTGLAAEQLGRVAYLMDITPRYVAVTLERFTRAGLTPRLVTG